MKYFSESRCGLQKQCGLQGQAAPASRGIPIFVPDTNVLMDVAGQGEGDVSSFAWGHLKGAHEEVLLIIIPPVVKELHELKRSKDERRKKLTRAAIASLWDAQGGTRKELGVEMAPGLLVGFLASEPNAEDFEYLTWLDASRPDHRIISSVLDVSRRHLRDQVALITGDLNVHIFAGYAAILALKLGESMPSDEP